MCRVNCKKNAREKIGHLLKQNRTAGKQNIKRDELPGHYIMSAVPSGSAATRLLGLRVRIPLGAWMSVCCECCVLWGRGLCIGLITRPEESYRVWCVWVWSWSLDNDLRHAERFPCHAAFTAVPIFFFFCPTSVSILRGICVYVHISDRVQTVHELPLLPSNTASETSYNNLYRCTVHFVESFNQHTN